MTTIQPTTDTPVDVAPGSGAMFDRIARRYDLLNRLISLGLDRRWRRAAVDALDLGAGERRVLDVATGTGDLAIEILARHPGVEVTGLDPSSEMLERAVTKVARKQLDARFAPAIGVAESLPYPGGSFAAVTIGFGLRNVSDRGAALAEMMRVLEPGGRLAILELTEPRGPRWAALARFHIHHVIPRVGALLSGAREYRYLPDSIARFAAPSVIAAELREAGASRVWIEPMCFGAVHLFVAFAAGLR